MSNNIAVTGFFVIFTFIDEGGGKGAGGVGRLMYIKSHSGGGVIVGVFVAVLVGVYEGVGVIVTVHVTEGVGVGVTGVGVGVLVGSNNMK